MLIGLTVFSALLGLRCGSADLTFQIVNNYRDDYKTLVKLVRERGAAVPPLVNAYMNLSSTLRSFGTALNPGFGKVEETGILVTIADIYEEKVNRHMIYDKNELPSHLK